MTAPEEEVTPALFDHAKTVYEEMLKRSHKEPMQYNDSEGVTQLSDDREVDIYEGHLTRLFADLSIANPYYTKIKNALVGQNCIEQLRRGGGVGLSKWILHSPPTEDGFRQIAERKRATTGKDAILQQRIKDLTGMVNDLVGQVESLSDKYSALYDDVMTMKGAS